MKGTRILSAAEFAAVRARAQAKPAPARPALKVAKASLTRNRPAPPLGASTIVIPKPDPRADALHTIKAVPGRVMALDLSMKKTGIAWGTPGFLPLGSLTLCAGSDGSYTEAEHLHGMSKSIAWQAASKHCGLAIFSEWYSAKNMLAFRANVSLRGAVMAALARYGIPCVGVAEITARKAAGVNVKAKRDDEEKGYMKERAYQRLNELGLGHLQEDEGDAAILLLGAWVPLGLPAPANFKERTPTLAEGGISKAHDPNTLLV